MHSLHNMSRRWLPMRSVAPASLSFSFSTLSIDAPKRKAADIVPASGRAGHYGLASDSSRPVRLVALSRVLAQRDEQILESAARTSEGAAFLAALRGAVLRVAKAVGGADAALDESNVVTLFNLAASHVQQRRLYDAGLSLPIRLPWPEARALLGALLDGLGAVRTSSARAGLALSLMQLPAQPFDAEAQGAMMAVVAAIEAEMTARLSGTAGSSSGGGSSSAASARSTPPPPELPLAVAVEIPSAVDVTVSLTINVRRLLEGRLARLLTVQETAQLEDAMAEALSVLQAGGDETRRQVLAASMAEALMSPGAAQVWASAVEAADASVASPSAFFRALLSSTGAIAGVLFASAAFGV